MATKDQPKTLTPKLRFPEFRRSAGWKAAPLSSVLTEERLRSDGKAEVHSVSLTKGVVPQIEHMGCSFSAADTSHYGLVRPFDVIYTKSPLAIFKLGIVKQHRGPRNALVSPLYGVFTPVNRHVGQLIVAHFDSPSRSMPFLEPLCQKGAKNTIQISNDRFLSGELFLPSDEKEQEKIADCLTSMDELLAAVGRELEALRAHKKGLTQQLFPREAESRPRLRFPEFRDAGEWETKPLSSFISSLDAGVSVLAGDRPTTDGEVGVLKTSCVTDGIFDPSENKVVLDATQRGRMQEPVRADTIIISRMNTVALVGANAYVDRDIDNLFLPDRLWAAKGTSRENVRFIAYVTGSDRGREALSAAARGSSGSMKNISKPDVLGLQLAAPGLAEQQRIAACLSSLDALIAAQSRKLDGLRTHKKGLMQQLFPSPEGV